MFRAMYLSLAFLVAPLAACGDVVITRPHYATPSDVAQNTQYALLYLECGDIYTTAHAVSMLTLAQLNDPDTTIRFTRGLPDKCRAGNVTKYGTYHGFKRAVTRDGWAVDVVAWTQSNGWEIAFVDTAQAHYVGVPRKRHIGSKRSRRDDRLEVDDFQQLMKKKVEEELLRRLQRQ